MTEPRSSPFFSARRARRVDWGTALRYVGIGIAAALVLGGAIIALAWGYADRQLEQQDLGALERETPPPIEGTLNVLAVGTDSREGLTDEQLQELGTEGVSGERADTIILIHLSPERPEAVMVSFPRDLLVTIPGHGDGKLNAALTHGGPDLMVEAVEDYTGVQIDHYVQVNIAGFLEVVDVLDGVELCLDEPLRDPAAGADLDAGCQVLRGADAAGYVRARKTDPRGDIGRIDRQQRFIKAAMREVVSAGTLVNPLRVKRLIDSAAGALLTDDGLGTSRMFRVAWSLRELDPDDVHAVTVPVHGETIDGGYYAVAEPEEAESIFQSIRSGGDLPDGPNATPNGGPVEVVPADVEVTVLNGTTVTGLAARAGEALEERGFVVVEIGDADRQDVQGTVVRYGPEDEAAARLVAEQFASADLEQAGDAGVVVVLGTEEVDGGTDR